MVGVASVEYRFGSTVLPWDLWNRAQERIKTARNPVALTGAGISLASGIPLENGTIDDKQVCRIFDPDYFHRHPREYYDLYERILNAWRSAVPNAAHFALSKAGCRVVTLNIDGLHRDAGTNDLIEMHGNLRELRCRRCEAIFDSWSCLNTKPPLCPTCQSVLHPGICLEGDEVRHFSLAHEWVERCDVFLIIGTSLSDSPACELPLVAQKNGIDIIRIDSDAEQVVERLLMQ